MTTTTDNNSEPTQVPQVRLVALSQPVGDIEGPQTPEDVVVYCARASNPKNQANFETGARLLRYLGTHKHWSPFEMVSINMEIVTTRDIARQILRHRSFSFQEFSQRYAEVKDFAYREARLQDVRNRQNSLQLDSEDERSKQILDDWEESQATVWDFAISHYEKALRDGVAKEQARALLPEGMAVSVMYMMGSLRSWIHYVDLRSGPETQLEHRLIAEECKSLISKHFPNVALAMDW